MVGDIDPLNPTSLKKETLINWNSQKVIDWLGWIDNVGDILKKTDILCLPSYREGLPKALIEGASFGLPIVTTDTVGCRDVVQDGVNGFLVPIKNSTALENAILKLIKDEKLRVRMGKESYNLASNKFSSRIIISQTMDIYNEMNF